MTSTSPPYQRLQDVIARIREASRDRFARAPGSDEHQAAIDAEITLDHELDDAVKEATTAH
jgi:hypothetical protein